MRPFCAGACFKSVAFITDQGGSTSHQMKKTRPRPIRARMMTPLRGRVDSIVVIAIMWMGRGGVTSVESTSGWVTGTSTMRMNG